MTSEEFTENLKQAVENTIEDLKPTIQITALSAKALLTRRIQNEGFGKRYRSRQYLSLRAKRGFETRFVNLTFTGNMFRGWKRPAVISDNLRLTGTVGGVDKSTMDKLRWNKSRYPNFNQLNDEESEIIKESLGNKITEAIKNNMFKS